MAQVDQLAVEFLARLVHRLALPQHLALRRRQQAAQHAQQAGLARAVGPDHAQQLAWPQRDIDAAEQAAPAAHAAQVAQFQTRTHDARAPPRLAGERKGGWFESRRHRVGVEASWRKLRSIHPSARREFAAPSRSAAPGHDRGGPQLSFDPRACRCQAFDMRQVRASMPGLPTVAGERTACKHHALPASGSSPLGGKSGRRRCTAVGRAAYHRPPVQEVDEMNIAFPRIVHILALAMAATACSHLQAAGHARRPVRGRCGRS